jgi:prepilin-type N-terminal cleavage/methylation domain-containing protein
MKHKQYGLTLMEMLVAMSISLVVSLAMVGLMANTLGTGTQTIGAARLTSEMRAALQIMSRDLRRANYHANFMKCFGNLDCRSSLDNGDGDASAYVQSITIDLITADTGDCFYFWLDRNADGDIGNDDVGAFRLGTVNGVGVIQMTTDLKPAPDCDQDADWADITDPDVVNVTEFLVTNNLSYVDATTGATQTVDKIGMSITGNLLGKPDISRTVGDVIRVRNDIYAIAP